MTASNIASGFVIALIPTVQIGILYRVLWVPDSPVVDREKCECSCFDAVFKGTYEIQTKRHGYKHVYFNATWQTMCVWSVTVFYILLGYEALKTFTSLLLSRSLRPIMAVVFCLGVYPHVYAWFAFFNYYNDDFYPMFNHQVYFAITEMISSYAILKSCDCHVRRNQWLYCVIVGTASVHLVIGSLDQFIINLFLNKGQSHQVWRDVGLAAPDFINIFLPVMDFVKSERANTRQNILNQNGFFTFAKKKVSTSSTWMKYVLVYTGAILILGFSL